MPDNPYEVPPQITSSDPKTQEKSAGKDAYNIVSDTLTGVNVRKRDNLIQLAAVAVSTLIFAGVGAILAIVNSSWQLPWYGGALLLGFLGMVFGLFASGIFLMVYRFVRHVQGKHD